MTPDELEDALRRAGYLPNRETSIAVSLALALSRPLFVEGPPGVGKTELALAAATALDRQLVRLQCYEGLDESRVLFEWDHAKQILATQLLREAVARDLSGLSTVEAAQKLAALEGAFFDRRYLIARPVLRALLSETPAVLLVDEVDRADPELEALLLEVLASNEISIPELGTLRAVHPPLVLLTSNGTRDMTDALRRRCLHLFLEHPTAEREIAIVLARVPGIDRALVARVVELVGKLRTLELKKAPSPSETVDFARALLVMARSELDRKTVDELLPVLVKYAADRDRARKALG